MAQQSLKRGNSCQPDEGRPCRAGGPRQHLIRHLSSDQFVSYRVFAIKAFPAVAGFDYGLLSDGERR